MSYLFILDENKDIVPIDDVLEWAEWIKDADRCVAKVCLGNIHVFTVFLGVGHSWDPNNLIDMHYLFETAIFSLDGDDKVVTKIERRYKTYDEALKGHEQVVKSLRKEFSNGKCSEGWIHG